MIFLILLCIAPAFTVEAKIASNGRIVNGQNATEGQFPWQVAVFVFYNQLYFHPCGGTIISEEWILTTAQCLTPFYAVVVQYGVTDLTNSGDNLIDSYKYIIHEDFDNVTMKNNIALIHLDPPLIFDDKTSAIALSSEGVEAGIKATISGFGHSNFDVVLNMTSVLQYTSVSTIDSSECEQTYGDMVSSGTICAVGDNQINSPCIGDEGGPLVISADTDNPILIGIFSFVGEDGCNNKAYPSVYTKTSYYREWIRDKTGI